MKYGWNDQLNDYISMAEVTIFRFLADPVRKNTTHTQCFCRCRYRWLQEELADGPKNAAEVEKKALTQGMTQKQLRTAKEYTGVSIFSLNQLSGGY